jgi:hypothetical protein
MLIYRCIFEVMYYTVLCCINFAKYFNTLVFGSCQIHRIHIGMCKETLRMPLHICDEDMDGSVSLIVVFLSGMINGALNTMYIL